MPDSFYYRSFREAVIHTLKSLFFMCVILFATSLHAQDGISEEQLENHSAILEKVEYDLSLNHYDERKLPETIKQVTQIMSEVTQCVSAESLYLDKLKSDLASLGEPARVEQNNVKQKRLELNAEITKTEKLLANCRVLSLRSEETLKHLSESRQALLAARLLSQGPTIKNLLQENLDQSSLWYESTKSFLSDNIGIDLFSTLDVLALMVIIIIASIVGTIFGRHIFKRANNMVPAVTFSNCFTQAFLATFGYYIPYLLISISVAVFCYLLTSQVSPVPFISVVAYGLPIYVLSGALIELFLNPRQPAVPCHKIPEKPSMALARRLKVFLLLLFTGYLLFTTLLAQSLPEETYLLARGIFAIVFILNIIWVVWLLGKIPKFSDTFVLRIGIGLILISILVAELLGYRNLSIYAIRGVLGTLILFGALMLVSRLLCELFDGLDQGNRNWQRYIRDLLGVKSHKKLPGLTWVRFVAGVVLWFVFIIIVLRLWELSETGFQQLRFVLVEGFTVGSLNIIPARILLALIFLSVLLAVSGWFRAHLERSWLLRTRMDRGAREAMATISGYIGLAIAIITAMSVAGIEFGNLAIIAGALSVGIGFGLQNIVNNFVSGLILLFERPVKTGDWVIVGSTEGYVKKISIRSTQIQTFDQADVIVPNSELISGQVTNWMLRDVRGRIRVPVGVAYGSDTMQVNKLLLDIAINNGSVITDGSSPEPKVLFMEFGDSALLFELRVFIDNIDKKYQVTSDLNFAIDAAFREHDIQIPFPQRDIHIKNGPDNPTNIESDNTD